MAEFDKKILIIEDDETQRRIIEEALKPLGVELIEAEDGKEGLHLLSVNYEDIFLVIVDILMPVMNGIEFLEIACKRYPLIEYLILTADDSPGYARSSLKSGAAKYYHKPINPNEMIFIVEKSKEVYNMRQKNHLLLRKLRKKEYADQLKTEYQSLCEGLAQEIIQNEDKISELVQFIKDNESRLDIPESIKTIISSIDDYEEL